MKHKYVKRIMGVIFLFSSYLVHAQNQTITDWLTYVNADSLKRNMVELESFRCRYAPKGNKHIAGYLVERLQQYGIHNARIDSAYVEEYPEYPAYYYNNTIYNVRGDIPGSAGESVYILGAHYDAIAFDGIYLVDSLTAGADDNASGCAVLLEIARIFHQCGIAPVQTISFMLFDAEEVGLIGAFVDARLRKGAGESVALMINNDMVANQPEDEVDWKLKIFCRDNGAYYNTIAGDVCRNYTILEPLFINSTGDSFQGSDNWAYYKEGFKSVFFREDNFSPHYHTLMDNVAFCNIEYLAEITRFNLAYLCTLTGNVQSSVENKKGAAFSFKVFPNPASGYTQVTLSYTDESRADGYIYDMQGALCKTFRISSGKEKIDISDLTPGAYFIKIVFPDQSSLQQKLIKL